MLTYHFFIFTVLQRLCWSQGTDWHWRLCSTFLTRGSCDGSMARAALPWTWDSHKSSSISGSAPSNLLKQSTPRLVWRPWYHHLALTSAREYFGEASMEAQAHTILKTLTTSSYTPLVYQYVMFMVLVSLFVERPTKAIYIIIFNIILTWTFSSYTQRSQLGTSTLELATGATWWLFIWTCLCLNWSQTSNSLPHSSVFILSSICKK